MSLIHELKEVAKTVKCDFGFHDWKHTKAEYYLDRKFGIAIKEATRTCSKCRKHQYLDEHCLGLNPPKYIYTWYEK